MKIFLNRPESISGENRIDFLDDVQTTMTCNDVTICLLGKIFNEREIIQSYEPAATNIYCALSDMYKKHGFYNTIFMLDGEFSITLFDHKSRSLYVGCDAYGICPIYTIPPVAGSTIWKITDKCDTVVPVSPGTYSTFTFTDNEWKLYNTDVRYYHVPSCTLPIDMLHHNELQSNIYFIQYIKYAIQKRIDTVGTQHSYYLNYNPLYDTISFAVAWIVQQLYPQLTFYIYSSDVSGVPEHWHKAFNHRIRTYILCIHDYYEISVEEYKLWSWSDTKLLSTELLPNSYELIIQQNIRTFHTKKNNKCIWPMMDTALIQFYLTQIPLNTRMSNKLMEKESLIASLPVLVCRE